MIKPKAVKKGDTIGLVAPSSPYFKPGALEESIKILEEQGFNLVVGESCRARYGHLSGSDELRARDVNNMFADNRIDAVFCLKGGYGTPRILDRLDYKMIRNNPKLFIGYSDITAIHIALNQLCELVTIHGPMAVSDMIDGFQDFSKESYLRAISSVEALGELSNPLGETIKCMVSGKTSGKIVGGNLSLICATLGTPYEIDTKDKILFIEDIDEYTYRVDRMLTQLRLAGKFEDCVGIVLGDFNNCIPQYEEFGLSLTQVFEDIITPANKPTIFNFKAGHCLPSITIPLGVMAQLDADACKFEVMENALV